MPGGAFGRHQHRSGLRGRLVRCEGGCRLTETGSSRWPVCWFASKVWRGRVGGEPSGVQNRSLPQLLTQPYTSESYEFVVLARGVQIP